MLQMSLDMMKYQNLINLYVALTKSAVELARTNTEARYARYTYYYFPTVMSSA